MKWRRAGTICVAAGALALAISQPFDDQQRLSVRLWLAVTATAVAGVIVLFLVQHLPTPQPQVRRRWRPRWWPRRQAIHSSETAAELRAVASLVARATGNARTHNSQLRPRLTALADHIVPRRATTEAARTQELVRAAGDHGWLLDPAVDDRVPTIEEIDRFLDHILDDTPTTSDQNTTSRTP